MPPSGDIEPPSGFEDALKAFKEAFTQWRADVPENLEHESAGVNKLERRLRRSAADRIKSGSGAAVRKAHEKLF